MRAVRVFVAVLLVFGLSTSAFAGDLLQSIAKAAQQETAPPSETKIPRGYLLSGGGLFVAGMTMAIYGFLHTNGGEFVSGAVSKESNTGLGGAGLAVAGAGGAILFMGSRRARRMPSVTMAPGRGITVSKHISW